jgi:hypothetical protein
MKAWDSVDNRMGQLVYDNLFWKRTLKDIGLIGIRSLGWNLGTVRELGGGLKDVGKLAHGELTHRSAYVVALPMTVGMIGAVMCYLYTGHGPTQLKDYFFVPTGRKKPDGDEERVQVASYMKDIAPLITAAGHEGAPGAIRHVARTAINKLHPTLGMVGDMLSNEDYWGDQIVNKHDPIMVQAQQSLDFVVKEFLPIAVRNIQQRKKAGAGVSQQVESVFGIVPAPAASYRTEAEQAMSEYSRGKARSRTPEEAEKGARRSEVMSQLRRGERPEIPVEFGKSQVKSMRRAAKTDYLIGSFKMLTEDEAEKVWAKTTEEERKQLRPYFNRKIENAMRNTRDPEERARLKGLRQGIRER